MMNSLLNTPSRSGAPPTSNRVVMTTTYCVSVANWSSCMANIPSSSTRYTHTHTHTHTHTRGSLQKQGRPLTRRIKKEWRRKNYFTHTPHTNTTTHRHTP